MKGVLFVTVCHSRSSTLAYNQSPHSRSISLASWFVCGLCVLPPNYLYRNISILFSAQKHPLASLRRQGHLARSALASLLPLLASLLDLYNFLAPFLKTYLQFSL